MESVGDAEARRLVALSGPLLAVLVVGVWRWAMPVHPWLSVAWVFSCAALWVVVVAGLPEAWQP